jgi:hypothetical protein
MKARAPDAVTRTPKPRGAFAPWIVAPGKYVMEFPVAGIGNRLIVPSLRFPGGFMLVSALCPHSQFTRMSVSVRQISRGVNENA